MKTSGPLQCDLMRGLQKEKHWKHPAVASMTVVLALAMAVCPLTAAITETFSTPNNDGQLQELPGVWQHVGSIVAGGRGATSDTNRRAMSLDYGESAETILLTWDPSAGRNVNFWYNLDCSGSDISPAVLKVFAATGSGNWDQLLAITGDKMAAGQSEYASVPIPESVTTTNPQFAIKWLYEYTQMYVGCFSGMLLDDITLPALPVDNPSPSPNPDQMERDNTTPSTTSPSASTPATTPPSASAPSTAPAKPALPPTWPKWATPVVIIVIAMLILAGGYMCYKFCCRCHSTPKPKNAAPFMGTGQGTISETTGWYDPETGEGEIHRKQITYGRA